MSYSKDWAFVAVLMLIVVSSALDLLADLSHGAAVSHVLKEGLVMLLAFAVALWMLLDLRRQRWEIAALRDASRRAPQPSAAVLAERKRFADMVNGQFQEWRLTESEQAVGWLLLKGLSLKEIAALRQTLEKTVRQQASAIYRKAGLPGRHVFAAWFIEDLL